METAVITSLIAGVFSLATALGSVWLKHHLESRDSKPANTPSPSPLAPARKGEPPAVPRRPLGLLLGRAAAVIATGVFLGAVSRGVRNWLPGPVHYEAIASLALLALVSLVLALARQARHLSYQLEVFSLWAAFLAGWSLIHRSVWSDAVFSFGMGWLACAVVGSVVIASRQRNAA
ncbi:hypothetical protein ACX12L_11060 [Alicycliphilus sp. T452]|jgi:hypothetical protein